MVKLLRVSGMSLHLGRIHRSFMHHKWHLKGMAYVAKLCKSKIFNDLQVRVRHLVYVYSL
jgi:hypothetical protein